MQELFLMKRSGRPSVIINPAAVMVLNFSSQPPAISSLYTESVKVTMEGDFSFKKKIIQFICSPHVTTSSFEVMTLRGKKKSSSQLQSGSVVGKTVQMRNV